MYAKPPEPIRISKLLDYPQIAIRFYGPLSSDEKLFVLIDMYSSYPIGEIMKKTSAQSVIKKLMVQQWCSNNNSEQKKSRIYDFFVC